MAIAELSSVLGAGPFTLRLREISSTMSLGFSVRLDSCSDLEPVRRCSPKRLHAVTATPECENRRLNEYIHCVRSGPATICLPGDQAKRAPNEQTKWKRPHGYRFHSVAQGVITPCLVGPDRNTITQPTRRHPARNTRAPWRWRTRGTTTAEGSATTFRRRRQIRRCRLPPRTAHHRPCPQLWSSPKYRPATAQPRWSGARCRSTFQART